MPPTSDTIYLYHITHIDNLPGILQAGCLQCQHHLGASGVHPVNIAHAGIQERRASTIVSCGPGGTLHDYVPFYFAPRSPMLYAIHRNNVETYTGGQRPLIYLVSNVSNIQVNGHDFVFTDGHPTVAFTQYYTSLTDIDLIDWSLMKQKYWNDITEDPDRKRRRQAEFLVYNQVNLPAFIGIATIDQQIQQRVEQILSTHQIDLSTRIRSNWYY